MTLDEFTTMWSAGLGVARSPRNWTTLAIGVASRLGLELTYEQRETMNQATDKQSKHMGRNSGGIKAGTSKPMQFFHCNAFPRICQDCACNLQNQPAARTSTKEGFTFRCRDCAVIEYGYDRMMTDAYFRTYERKLTKFANTNNLTDTLKAEHEADQITAN